MFKYITEGQICENIPTNTVKRDKNYLVSPFWRGSKYLTQSLFTKICFASNLMILTARFVRGLEAV